MNDRYRKIFVKLGSVLITHSYPLPHQGGKMKLVWGWEREWGVKEKVRVTGHLKGP
jgi:hypothetical protein